MSAFSFGLIVELIVGVLLAATIAYCYILDRRLTALRSGESELKAIIEQLDVATRRAQAAIAGLKENASGVASDLERDLRRARGLADELSLMVEAGDHIADRLSELSSADPEAAEKAIGKPRSGADEQAGQEAGSEEQGLAAALRQVR